MLLTTWYEGRVNLNLRQEGTADYEKYYPKTNSYSNFLGTAGDSPEDFAEYYDINPDFGFVNDIKQGAIFKKETTLKSSYSTRIVRTQPYYGVGETYRTLLAADYLDLQRNRGELCNLSAVNNVIVPHLERAIVLTKGREEIKINDLSTAYLGSGDIFSVKPDEILMTEEGYAGNQSQFASVVTQYGYFFVDRKARKIYLYDGKINEISSFGMANWFETNLQSELEKYRFIYPDTPANFFGLQAGFDSYNKRILLSKRDKKPTAAFESLVVLERPITDDSAYIIYVEEEGKFELTTPVIGGGTQTRFLKYNETEYFTDNNWTISFSLEKKAWISFHDYTPDCYIKDLNGYLSAFGHRVYKHDNTSTMGNIYESTEKSKFIVEFVDHYQGEEFYTPSFKFITTCLNQDGGKELYKTFDSFFVYNSFQNSGEVPLEHLDTARALRDTWIVNKFRDLVLDPSQPIVNKDLTINENNINVNTPWYERRRFIDNYVVIRLIFENLENNLLFLHSAESNVKKSYR